MYIIQDTTVIITIVTHEIIMDTAVIITLVTHRIIKDSKLMITLVTQKMINCSFSDAQCLNRGIFTVF